MWSNTGLGMEPEVEEAYQMWENRKLLENSASEPTILTVTRDNIKTLTELSNLSEDE